MHRRELYLLAISVVPLACTDASAPRADRFATIAVGGYHACGLSETGIAYCWGFNGSGQVGATTTETCTTYPCATLPTRVLVNRAFGAIAAGGEHTCALDLAGAAYCWGSNKFGELGTGELADSMSTEPRPVVGGHRFASISAWTHFTCALTSTGSAYCWGENFSGQLGNGDTASAVPSPTPVTGGLRFTSITAGSNFACGVVAGTLRCWGDNTKGQLGLADNVQRLSPTSLSPTFYALAVAAGGLHACAVRTDHSLFCWGDNIAWQASDSSASQYTEPHLVAGMTGAQAVSAGSAFSCAININDTTFCWGAKGWGEFGLLGQGQVAESPVPMPVVGGLTFRTLASGDALSCALTTDARLYCWGSGFRGQLGNGSLADTPTPTEVVLSAP